MNKTFKSEHIEEFISPRSLRIVINPECMTGGIEDEYLEFFPFSQDGLVPIKLHNFGEEPKFIGNPNYNNIRDLRDLSGQSYFI